MLLNRRSIHQWFEGQYGFPGLNRDVLSQDAGAAEAAEAAAPRVHQPAVILPVIHVDTLEQTMRNVEVVKRSGCKGCFLINQREVRGGAAAASGKRYAGYPLDEMLPVVKAVRRAHLDIFLGVNFLAVTGDHAFPVLARLAKEGCVVDAYWADNAMIDERTEAQPAADRILKARNDVAHDWNGLYLGGVCFKAQREVPPENWEVAARRACAVSLLAGLGGDPADEKHAHPPSCPCGAHGDAPAPPRHAIALRHGYMDVVMTSGVATGRAADLKKMSIMRRGVGGFKPLGLASGVTPENVTSYLGMVDVILVATGVSRSFHELDEAKLDGLMKKVSAWDACVLADAQDVAEHYPPELLWSDPSVYKRKKPCVPPRYSNAESRPQGARVSVPNSLALRKQHLLLMSGNAKDDFAAPSTMKHAWLDPSSACLAIHNLTEDFLVPFTVGPLASRPIDVVAGPDAAGFYYAAAMAQVLKCGFLTLRKHGKLPCPTMQSAYVNYTQRSNTMEVRTNFDFKGKTAIVVDQWIETGGTMEACIDLLERLGMHIAGVCVVGFESNERERVAKLAAKYPVFAAIPACLRRCINARDLPAVHAALQHPATPKAAPEPHL